MDTHTLYQQRLNLQGAIFSRIDHDDAMVAIVYKVTLPTGVELILKISRRPSDYLREVYFLKQFAGALPVPRIIQLIQPETGVNGAILMECLRGALLKITDFTYAMAYELGSCLARIHLNRVGGYGDLTEPQNLSSDPRVYFIPKYEEGFTECSNHLPQALLEQCRSYFKEHIALLATVDGPCIVHRDFRAGNVIVGNGKIQGIIDWASGRASFAEEDFCPIEHGEWPMDQVRKKSFLAGYAGIRQVPDYSAIMPLLRMSRALATIGFTVKSGTWNNSHARAYQFNRQFLETFF
jgi:aminoglycoside phosphotransferase (APT) family kinase protein